MEYNILIETDFFNLLNAGHKNKGGNALENSYREFIKVVVMQHQREASGLCTVIRRDRA